VLVRLNPPYERDAGSELASALKGVEAAQAAVASIEDALAKLKADKAKDAISKEHSTLLGKYGKTDLNLTLDATQSRMTTAVTKKMARRQKITTAESGATKYATVGYY
jgi:hypothetical protein